MARLQRFRLLYIPQQTANNYVASCILVIVAKEELYSPLGDVRWVDIEKDLSFSYRMCVCFVFD